MEKQSKWRAKTAVWLCVVLLAACLSGLACYLKPTEAPEAGVFGMMLVDVPDEQTAESYHLDSSGVYVMAVQENSQAERAGIASGDRLVHVNQTELNSRQQFQAMQERFAPSEKVHLHFSRGGDRQLYEVTLVWTRNGVR